MSVDVFSDVHATATRTSIHDIAKELVDRLGGTLVATLANVRDRKLPYRWAKPDGTDPQIEAEVRLRAAYQIWLLLTKEDNDYVARAWFIGTNPRLGDRQPVMALRDGLYSETFAAAAAFVTGTDQ